MTSCLKRYKMHVNWGKSFLLSHGQVNDFTLYWMLFFKNGLVCAQFSSKLTLVLNVYALLSSYLDVLGYLIFPPICMPKLCSWGFNFNLIFKLCAVFLTSTSFFFLLKIKQNMDTFRTTNNILHTNFLFYYNEKS